MNTALNNELTRISSELLSMTLSTEMTDEQLNIVQYIDKNIWRLIELSIAGRFDSIEPPIQQTPILKIVSK